jgi:hypothetical protein
MSALSVTIPVNTANAVSAAIPNNQYVIGMYIPTIDNSIVYIQASENGVDGWARVLRSDGTNDWNCVASTGNRWIFLDQMAPFKFLRVEVAVAQNAVRTFIFVQKPNMEGNA